MNDNIQENSSVSNTDTRPIGIFDSGVGGLTVAKELRRILPYESTVYVGDTAHVPYGTKTPQELFAYGREIIEFLLKQNVKAVVIACGTSSATVFEQLRETFPTLPIIDVLRPAVDTCFHAITHDKKLPRLGLIATAATIRSGAFSRLLAEKSPNITLHSRACPLFAAMVEAGLPQNHPALLFAASTYLSDLRGKIDALVLGCTHYPLLTDAITAILGDIQFINIAEATALATRKHLQDMLADEKNAPTHTYYVSGAGDVFAKTGKIIIGEECNPQTMTHR